MSEENEDTFPQLAEANRLCSLLHSDDRFVRKLALLNFENLVRHESFLSYEKYHQIFLACHTLLISKLRDPAEIVREQAIHCIGSFLLHVLPTNDFYLSHVMPVFVERIGTAERVEETEELRLLILEFIFGILREYNAPQLKVCAAEFVLIFTHSIQDNYAPVKNLCMKCIMHMASVLRPEDFEPHTQTLIKPIIPTLRHQHQKTRVIGVYCVGEIMLRGNHYVITEGSAGLAARLFDERSDVRQAVYEIVGNLMLNHRDRYSYFHILLPLLLTGLHDATPKVQHNAEELWFKVGKQYQKENEADFKDEMDYLIEPPKHYPKGLKRPNLGCRVLLQRNISKLLPALCRELSSWQDDIRIRCSQLLCVIIVHSEASIIQHLPTILQHLNVACRDGELNVTLNVMRAAEFMGCFLPLTSWTKPVLLYIENGHLYGGLLLLTNFLKGTPHDLMTSAIFQKMVKTVANKEILYKKFKEPLLLQALEECLVELLVHYTPDMETSIGQGLFNIIVSVNTSKHENADHEYLLRKLQGSSIQFSVWNRYLPSLLKDLYQNPRSWEGHSFQHEMLTYIILRCGSGFGDNLAMIAKILVKAMDANIEPSNRLKLFMALSTTMQRNKMQKIQFPDSYAGTVFDFCKVLILDVIAPALLWKAGRTADAIRTSAASTLACVLSFQIDNKLCLPPKIMNSVVTTLLPLLISIVDDTSSETRLLAIENIYLLKQQMVDADMWKLDDLILCYTNIIKRLDDPVKNVRTLSIEVLHNILTSPPKEFLGAVNRSHHEYIIDTLLVQFDGFDNQDTDLIYSVLELFVQINPEMLKTKITSYAPLPCNQSLCNELIEKLDNININ